MKDLFVRACLFAAVLGVPLGARPAAQEAETGVVRDLTDEEITEERLLEILTPKSGEHEPLGTRGLGVVTVTRPSCDSQRREMTRGLAPKPVADVAAVRIEFAFDSAELLPDARRELEILASVLDSPGLGGSCFRIEGHADSIGSESYNEQLSEARAEAVVRHLVERFQIDPERLLAVGYGERVPLADNGTERGRARNRRVQIANLGSGDGG